MININTRSCCVSRRPHKVERSHLPTTRCRIDIILDVLRPVNHEGSHHGETKRIPTASKNDDLIHIPLLGIGEIWGKNTIE